MPHHPNPSTATPPSAPPHRRGHRGLTTLEWLLIVAAVAGLAALAVVLVQNVVDDTAEQISGSSARLTAAQVAAQEINEECKEDAGADCKGATVSADSEQLKQAVAEAKSKCLRLVITYGDVFENAKIPPAQLVASNAATYLWNTAATATPCKIPDPPSS